jgi:hypothetical protein
MAEHKNTVKFVNKNTKTYTKLTQKFLKRCVHTLGGDTNNGRNTILNLE